MILKIKLSKMMKLKGRREERYCTKGRLTKLNDYLTCNKISVIQKKEEEEEEEEEKEEKEKGENVAEGSFDDLYAFVIVFNVCLFLRKEDRS